MSSLQGQLTRALVWKIGVVAPYRLFGGWSEVCENSLWVLIDVQTQVMLQKSWGVSKRTSMRHSHPRADSKTRHLLGGKQEEGNWMCKTKCTHTHIYIHVENGSVIGLITFVGNWAQPPRSVLEDTYEIGSQILLSENRPPLLNGHPPEGECPCICFCKFFKPLAYN